MQLSKEAAILIQSHLKATTSREWTIDTIIAQPYYKQVWAWWKALAYFKMNDDYERLEEAPEGISNIHVMDDTHKMYMWRNGRYEFIQELTEQDCKNIYGE